MWNSHGRATEQFYTFWLDPFCPDVFYWEPQCWEALTSSAGHCWVVVQCKKQVLNSQQQTGQKKKTKNDCILRQKNVEAWDTWAEIFFFSLLSKQNIQKKTWVIV